MAFDNLKDYHENREKQVRDLADSGKSSVLSNLEKMRERVIQSGGPNTEKKIEILDNEYQRVKRDGTGFNSMEGLPRWQKAAVHVNNAVSQTGEWVKDQGSKIIDNAEKRNTLVGKRSQQLLGNTVNMIGGSIDSVEDLSNNIAVLGDEINESIGGNYTRNFSDVNTTLGDAIGKTGMSILDLGLLTAVGGIAAKGVQGLGASTLTSAGRQSAWKTLTSPSTWVQTAARSPGSGLLPRITNSKVGMVAKTGRQTLAGSVPGQVAIKTASYGSIPKIIGQIGENTFGDPSNTNSQESKLRELGYNDEVTPAEIATFYKDYAGNDFDVDDFNSKLKEISNLQVTDKEQAKNVLNQTYEAVTSRGNINDFFHGISGQDQMQSTEQWYKPNRGVDTTLQDINAPEKKSDEGQGVALTDVDAPEGSSIQIAKEIFGGGIPEVFDTSSEEAFYKDIISLSDDVENMSKEQFNKALRAQAVFWGEGMKTVVTKEAEAILGPDAAKANYAIQGVQAEVMYTALNKQTMAAKQDLYEHRNDEEVKAYLDKSQEKLAMDLRAGTLMTAFMRGKGMTREEANRETLKIITGEEDPEKASRKYMNAVTFGGSGLNKNILDGIHSEESYVRSLLSRKVGSYLDYPSLGVDSIGVFTQSVIDNATDEEGFVDIRKLGNLTEEITVPGQSQMDRFFESFVDKSGSIVSSATFYAAINFLLKRTSKKFGYKEVSPNHLARSEGTKAYVARGLKSEAIQEIVEQVVSNAVSNDTGGYWESGFFGFVADGTTMMAGNEIKGAGVINPNLKDAVNPDNIVAMATGKDELAFKDETVGLVLEKRRQYLEKKQLDESRELTEKEKVEYNYLNDPNRSVETDRAKFRDEYLAVDGAIQAYKKIMEKNIESMKLENLDTPTKDAEYIQADMYQTAVQITLLQTAQKNGINSETIISSLNEQKALYEKQKAFIREYGQDISQSSFDNYLQKVYNKSFNSLSDYAAYRRTHGETGKNAKRIIASGASIGKTRATFKRNLNSVKDLLGEGFYRGDSRVNREPVPVSTKQFEKRLSPDGDINRGYVPSSEPSPLYVNGQEYIKQKYETNSADGLKELWTIYDPSSDSYVIGERGENLRDLDFEIETDAEQNVEVNGFNYRAIPFSNSEPRRYFNKEDDLILFNRRIRPYGDDDTRLKTTAIAAVVSREIYDDYDKSIKKITPSVNKDTTSTNTQIALTDRTIFSEDYFIIMAEMKEKNPSLYESMKSLAIIKLKKLGYKKDVLDDIEEMSTRFVGTSKLIDIKKKDYVDLIMGNVDSPSRMTLEAIKNIVDAATELGINVGSIPGTIINALPEANNTLYLTNRTADIEDGIIGNIIEQELVDEYHALVYRESEGPTESDRKALLDLQNEQDQAARDGRKDDLSQYNEELKDQVSEEQTKELSEEDEKLIEEAGEELKQQQNEQDQAAKDSRDDDITQYEDELREQVTDELSEEEVDEIQTDYDRKVENLLIALGFMDKPLTRKVAVEQRKEKRDIVMKRNEKRNNDGLRILVNSIKKIYNLSQQQLDDYIALMGETMYEIDLALSDVEYYSVIAKEHYKILEKLKIAQSAINKKLLLEESGKVEKRVFGVIPLTEDSSISAEGVLFNVSTFLKAYKIAQEKGPDATRDLMRQARVELLFAISSGRRNLLKNYFTILKETQRLGISQKVKTIDEYIDAVAYSHYYDYSQKVGMEDARGNDIIDYRGTQQVYSSDQEGNKPIGLKTVWSNKKAVVIISNNQLDETKAGLHDWTKNQIESSESPLRSATVIDQSIPEGGPEDMIKYVFDEIDNISGDIIIDGNNKNPKYRNRILKKLISKGYQPFVVVLDNGEGGLPTESDLSSEGFTAVNPTDLRVLNENAWAVNNNITIDASLEEPYTIQETSIDYKEKGKPRIKKRHKITINPSLIGQSALIESNEKLVRALLYNIVPELNTGISMVKQENSLVSIPGDTMFYKMYGSSDSGSGIVDPNKEYKEIVLKKEYDFPTLLFKAKEMGFISEDATTIGDILTSANIEMMGARSTTTASFDIYMITERIRNLISVKSPDTAIQDAVDYINNLYENPDATPEELAIGMNLLNTLNYHTVDDKNNPLPVFENIKAKEIVKRSEPSAMYHILLSREESNLYDDSEEPSVYSAQGKLVTPKNIKDFPIVIYMDNLNLDKTNDPKKAINNMNILQHGVALSNFEYYIKAYFPKEKKWGYYHYELNKNGGPSIKAVLGEINKDHIDLTDHKVYGSFKKTAKGIEASPIIWALPGRLKQELTDKGYIQDSRKGLLNNDLDERQKESRDFIHRILKYEFEGLASQWDRNKAKLISSQINEYYADIRDGKGTVDHFEAVHNAINIARNTLGLDPIVDIQPLFFAIIQGWVSPQLFANMFIAKDFNNLINAHLLVEKLAYREDATGENNVNKGTISPELAYTRIMNIIMTSSNVTQSDSLSLYVRALAELVSNQTTLGQMASTFISFQDEIDAELLEEFLKRRIVISYPDGERPGRESQIDVTVSGVLGYFNKIAGLDVDDVNKTLQENLGKFELDLVEEDGSKKSSDFKTFTNYQSVSTNKDILRLEALKLMVGTEATFVEPFGKNSNILLNAATAAMIGEGSLPEGNNYTPKDIVDIVMNQVTGILDSRTAKIATSKNRSNKKYLRDAPKYAEGMEAEALLYWIDRNIRQFNPEFKLNIRDVLAKVKGVNILKKDKLKSVLLDGLKSIEDSNALDGLAYGLMGKRFFDVAYKDSKEYGDIAFTSSEINYLERNFKGILSGEYYGGETFLSIYNKISQIAGGETEAERTYNIRRMKYDLLKRIIDGAKESDREEPPAKLLRTISKTFEYEAITHNETEESYISQFVGKEQDRKIVKYMDAYDEFYNKALEILSQDNKDKKVINLEFNKELKLAASVNLETSTLQIDCLRHDIKRTGPIYIDISPLEGNKGKPITFNDLKKTKAYKEAEKKFYKESKDPFITPDAFDKKMRKGWILGMDFTIHKEFPRLDEIEADDLLHFALFPLDNKPLENPRNTVIRDLLKISGEFGLMYRLEGYDVNMSELNEEDSQTGKNDPEIQERDQFLMNQKLMYGKIPGTERKLFGNKKGAQKIPKAFMDKNIIPEIKEIVQSTYLNIVEEVKDEISQAYLKYSETINDYLELETEEGKWKLVSNKPSLRIQRPSLKPWILFEVTLESDQGDSVVKIVNPYSLTVEEKEASTRHQIPNVYFEDSLKGYSDMFNYFVDYHFDKELSDKGLVVNNKSKKKFKDSRGKAYSTDPSLFFVTPANGDLSAKEGYSPEKSKEFLEFLSKVVSEYIDTQASGFTIMKQKGIKLEDVIVDDISYIVEMDTEAGKAFLIEKEKEANPIGKLKETGLSISNKGAEPKKIKTFMTAYDAAVKGVKDGIKSSKEKSKVSQEDATQEFFNVFDKAFDQSSWPKIIEYVASKGGEIFDRSAKELSPGRVLKKKLQEYLDTKEETTEELIANDGEKEIRLDEYKQASLLEAVTEEIINKDDPLTEIINNC